MDWTFLTAALAFVTLLSCLAVAVISKRQVDAQVRDEAVAKPTLMPNRH